MDLPLIHERFPLIYSYLDINAIKKQKKFIKVLNEPVSKADQRGFIYGFRKKTDEATINNFWIKLGRTDRFNPMTRIIEEWNGVPIFVIETAYNHKLEVLVHLIFDYAHQLRYSNKNEREIEWFFFEQPTNVLGIISQINILMNDTFKIQMIKILEIEQDEEVIVKRNRRFFCCFPLFCRTKNEKCSCNPVCCSYKSSFNNCEVGCCNCIPYIGVPNKNILIGCCLV
jgi:hypothetical protein